LSTLHREYAALLSLQYTSLCDFILNPVLPKAPEPVRNEIQETMAFGNLNEPQAIAILKAMKTSGFTLIQGLVFISFFKTIC
jgi:senataxin